MFEGHFYGRPERACASLVEGLSLVYSSLVEKGRTHFVRLLWRVYGSESLVWTVAKFMGLILLFFLGHPAAQMGGAEGFEGYAA
jgi:hypothetical protein